MVVPLELLYRFNDMGLILVPTDADKHPLITYKDTKTQTQDRHAVEVLYNTYKHIDGLRWAVYCVNGVVGMDYESAVEYEKFFGNVNTLTTASPGGGRHAFARSVVPCKAFKILGLELKVNTLCTIAGTGYEVIKDVEIKEFEDLGKTLHQLYPRFKTGKNYNLLKKIPISDVISKYTTKTGEGHNFWKAKCPLHGDTENSHLHVYEDSNQFHCFNCGKHGWAVDFVMFKEVCEFNEAVKKIEELLDIKINEDDEKKIPASTFRVGVVLYEQVLTGNHYQFVHLNDAGFEYEDKKPSLDENGDDIIYVPCVDEEVLKGAVVICPSAPIPYGTLKELIKRIERFIHKWLDIPDSDRKFFVYYILQTWVFEKFHTIGYGRVIGDTGVGKTRFLDVIGGLCYKPIITVGAVGAAPIFRLIDKHRGTMTIDEANFGRTDETQAIMTILNSGWEKGKPVIRCNKDAGMALNAFDAFCPKLLSTRKKFADAALEARCYTVTMTQTGRDDIPVNLDEVFFKERNELIGQLMAFRLMNINIIKPKPELQSLFAGIEPRVVQKALPLAAIVSHDSDALSEFITYVRESQADLIDERQGTIEGKTALAILDLYEFELDKNTLLQDIIISGEDIALRLNEYLPENKQTNHTKVGKMLKTLGIPRVQRVITKTVAADAVSSGGISGGGTKIENKRFWKRALDTPPKLLHNLLRRYAFSDDGSYPQIRRAVSSVSSTTESTETITNLKYTVTGTYSEGSITPKSKVSGSSTQPDTHDTPDTNPSNSLITLVTEGLRTWESSINCKPLELTQEGKQKFLRWYHDQEPKDKKTPPSEVWGTVQRIKAITPDKQNTDEDNTSSSDNKNTPSLTKTVGNKKYSIYVDEGEQP